MLHEEVLSLVEETLRRSKPGSAFTLGVLAALPALASSASAATLAASAIEGSAAAKSAAGVAWLSGIGGVIMGFFGAYLGVKLSLQNAQSDRERRFTKRMLWVGGGYMVAFLLGVLGLIFVREQLGLTAAGYSLALGGLIGIYMIGLWLLIAWAIVRHRKIRRESAAFAQPEDTVTIEPIKPFEYSSRWRLFGLPLVHIKFGRSNSGKIALAKGWIAIGDIALGVVLSIGGIAVGGVAIGGFGVGALAVGGAAFGALSLGGLAAGWTATGGLALAWHFALGGMALAREFAIGGFALASHANDALAMTASGENVLTSGAMSLTQYAQWLVLLALIPLFVGWRQLQRKNTEPQKTPTALLILALSISVAAGCAPAGAASRTAATTLPNGLRIVALHFPGSDNWNAEAGWSRFNQTFSGSTCMPDIRATSRERASKLRNFVAPATDASAGWSNSRNGGG